MSAVTVSPAEVKQTLERAAELLTPEGAWCQNHVSLDADGHPLPSGDSRVQSRCIAGAVHEASRSLGAGWIERHAAAMDRLKWHLGGWRDAWRWNDDAQRTQAEVLALLRETAAEVA